MFQKLEYRRQRNWKTFIAINSKEIEKSLRFPNLYCYSDAAPLQWIQFERCKSYNFVRKFNIFYQNFLNLSGCKWTFLISTTLTTALWCAIQTRRLYIVGLSWAKIRFLKNAAMLSFHLIANRYGFGLSNELLFIIIAKKGCKTVTCQDWRPGKKILPRQNQTLFY